MRRNLKILAVAFTVALALTFVSVPLQAQSGDAQEAAADYAEDRNNDDGFDWGWLGLLGLLGLMPKRDTVAHTTRNTTTTDRDRI